MKKISLIICLCLSSACFADNGNNNWYQINIVVFEHITAQNLNSEQWPQVTPPDTSYAITPDLLPTNKSQLKSAVSRLNRRKGYQGYLVLKSMSWLQQLPDNKTLNFHVVGAQSITDANQHELDGIISITKGRYFDIGTNLIITEQVAFLKNIGPVNFASATANSMYSFQMRQSLRIRSNQIGYIDHPLFGVLIKIVPLKTPPVQQPEPVVPAS